MLVQWDRDMGLLFWKKTNGNYFHTAQSHASVRVRAFLAAGRRRERENEWESEKERECERKRVRERERRWWLPRTRCCSPRLADGAHGCCVPPWTRSWWSDKGGKTNNLSQCGRRGRTGRVDKAAAAAVVSHQINFGLKSGQVFVSVYGDMELVPRALQEN